MLKNLWKQKRFKNWDEAFRSLTPSMRQHSVRVADYTQVIFDTACRASSYTKDYTTPDYMVNSYREVAYKCGFFHEIGKAMDPEAYADISIRMTEEEMSRKCRYTVEGRELVAKLQGEENEEEASLSNKMIQEACEEHLERWDGKGYPYGRKGSEISLIAQIVSLAKDLDNLVCGRRSENPFEEAVDMILQEEDKMYAARLLEVFTACQPELKNVYKKYIQYTKMMPKTIPLVEKRPDRPFGLNYRQIVKGQALSDITLEAVAWFGGALNDSMGKQTREEVEELLLRTSMVHDMSMYFLYEAADLLARMRNCGLHIGGVVLPMFAAFYEGENHGEDLELLYERTQIDKRKLMLTVPESVMEKNRGLQNRITEYLSNGVTLLLDQYHPEDLPVPLIRQMGFTHVRIAQDSTALADYPETIQELKSHGITVVEWPAGATYLTEDEMIRYLMDYEIV